MEFTTRGREKVPVGERNICKFYGITSTPMSGAAWKHKSDGVKGSNRYEIKETDYLSLSVKLEWILKIRKEANLTGKSPRLLFRIQNEIWVAMPAAEYFVAEGRCESGVTENDSVLLPQEDATMPIENPPPIPTMECEIVPIDIIGDKDET